MNNLFSSLNPYYIWYILMYLFWLVALNRIILFWLYLWQLKEYHIGRFLDHFSTSKGKSLLFNYLVAAKFGILIFILFGFRLQFIALATLLFAMEAGLTARSFLQNNLKHPVITKKSASLIFISHILAFMLVIFLFSKYLGEMSLVDFSLAALVLLLADLLAPIWVSAMVLVLQPFTVIGRLRLIDKAKKRRAGFKDLVVFGVTGSYGKSSTKELLAQILSQKFKVAKTQANQNSEVGASLTILNELKSDTQILVVEMGGYTRGGIKLLCDIARPQIGIISGINQQHLATFGSQQKIIDGKFELAAFLPEAGTLILNWDSEFVRQGFEKHKDAIKAKKIIKCSAEGQNDVWASDISSATERLLLTIHSGIEFAEINTNARGAHNVQPILLAVAGALSQGMKLPEIKTALESYDFSNTGIKVSRNTNPGEIKSPQTWGGLISPKPISSGNTRQFTILDSTYSANPDGVLSHLEYLKLFPGKKAIIMPCLIELGRSSKDVHYQIGKKIGEVCDLAIITTGDRYNEIKKGTMGAGMKGENIVFLENPEKIQNILKNRLAGGGTVLLEGRLSPPIIDLIKKRSKDGDSRFS